ATELPSGPAPVAHRIERLPAEQEAASSILARRTRSSWKARLAERRRRYGTSSTTKPGSGTHTVTCTLAGKTVSASAPFTVSGRMAMTITEREEHWLGWLD